MPNPSEFEARGHQIDTPLSIGQLNWYIKSILEQAVPQVWVEGEIADLSQPSSGHIYFTLKDEQSQIRSVIWRTTAAKLRFKLKDGLSIVCCGAVEVYPPRGSYQLIINKLQPQGIGPLQLAFQQLHQSLAAQGLFDVQRKKPLPKFPKRVGFVTSPSGAAVHDFIEASKNLWSDFTLTIIPARVQGEMAAKDIVRGIRLAHKLQPALDILIVGRGGGSMEDLWCFNEEVVVRAVCASRIPTISAVGHEIDVTLSDLAADARALTPTHAATLAFPNQAEIQSRLLQLRRRMDSMLRTRVGTLRQRLKNIAERSVLARPHEIPHLRRQQVDDWELRGKAAIWKLLAARKEKLASMARETEALSPLKVLGRGYSLTHPAGSQQPVRYASEVAVGSKIETILAHGRLLSQVEETHSE